MPHSSRVRQSPAAGIAPIQHQDLLIAQLGRLRRIRHGLPDLKAAGERKVFPPPECFPLRSPPISSTIRRRWSGRARCRRTFGTGGIGLLEHLEYALARLRGNSDPLVGNGKPQADRSPSFDAVVTPTTISRHRKTDGIPHQVDQDRRNFPWSLPGRQGAFFKELTSSIPFFRARTDRDRRTWVMVPRSETASGRGASCQLQSWKNRGCR